MMEIYLATKSYLFVVLKLYNVESVQKFSAQCVRDNGGDQNKYIL